MCSGVSGCCSKLTCPASGTLLGDSSGDLPQCPTFAISGHVQVTPECRSLIALIIGTGSKQHQVGVGVWMGGWVTQLVHPHTDVAWLPFDFVMSGRGICDGFIC